MATLGSLVINVAANASQMRKEMDRAQADVNMFAYRLQNSHSAPVAAFGNIMQNLPVALEAFGEAAGPVGILTAAVGGLMFGLKSAAEQFEQVSNKADQFGISVNQLKSLETLGDALSEDLFSGLAIFQKQLGGAAAGDTDLQKKFERIGLEWQKIAQLPADQQFAALADHVANTANQMDQVYIATEATGKSGAKLLPLLKQGAQGLADAQRELKFSGGMVSDRDIQKMQALDKMFDRFGRVWDAIKVKSGGALIGLLDLMERASSGGTLLKPVEDKAAVKEAQMAQMALRKTVSDTLDEYEKQAEQAGMTADAIVEANLRAKGATEEQLAAVRKWAAMAREAKEREAAQNDAAELLNKLNDQVNAFGLVGAEAEAFKLAMRGVPVEQIEKITQQLRELRDLNMAQAIEREFVSPVDTFINRMADLERLFDDGKIGLAQFAAAADAAFAKLPDLGKLSTNLPQALTAGSREAISFQNRANREAEAAASAERDPAKKLEDLRKALEKKAEDQIKKLEEIRKAIRDQNPVGEQNI